MADLTKNRIIEKLAGIPPTEYMEVDVAAGALEINKGELINYNEDGYATTASDSATDLAFAGIAIDALSQAAGGSDGDNKIRIIPAGTGVWVKMVFATALTVITGVPSTAVYVADSSSVDIAGNTTNDVPVGTIRKWLSSTSGWVQI
jgi:hypothetical protein